MLGDWKPFVSKFVCVLSYNWADVHAYRYECAACQRYPIWEKSWVYLYYDKNLLNALINKNYKIKKPDLPIKWLQQQPPEELAGSAEWEEIFNLGLFTAGADGGPILFLISAAIVMKACSTLVAFLAEVSRNGMPRESAYS